MEISNSKNVVSNAAIDAENNVIVGDNNKIFNLKEAAQSKALLEEIEELDRQLAKTREKIERYPDDPDFKQDMLRDSKKRNQKQEELDNLKKEILKLAEDFSRIPINTKRLRLAKQHFEAGEFKEARAVLDAEVMGQELDALLNEKDRLKSKMNKNEKQLKDKANEFLILARLTAVDYEFSDRFEKTIHYFEQSLQAWKTEENIFAFAYFLQEHNQFSKSLLLYEEALEIRKRLAQANPERYEPDVAGTQNNLGLMYADLNAYDKAETAYQEALEIYQRLAQANPERYEPYVAMTQNNLGLMYFGMGDGVKALSYLDKSLPVYKQRALRSPQAFDLKVARTLLIKTMILIDQGAQSAANDALLEAKTLAERYPAAPFSATILQYFDQYHREPNPAYEVALEKIAPFRQAINRLASEAEKAEPQRHIVSVLLDAYQDHLDNHALITALGQAYGQLAWYNLFAQRFVTAEQAAVEGLAVDPSQEWINTNLASALLFQGKYIEARSIYMRYKDNPFNDSMNFSDVFLQDLSELEKSRITHPDVEKIRELLQQ